MSYFCLVKLFKRFVSWTIWSVISLYLILMGLLKLPAAQSYIGNMTADALGGMLGTEVSIGHVNIGFPNRIIIDQLSLKDQKRKRMLSAARLTAKFDLLPLWEGKISISSAQIFGATVNLYRANADTKPNFQFVLDSLTSKDTTKHSSLDLRVNSFIMRRSDISYQQLDRPKTDGRFNPARLHIKDVSAYISLKKLTDDSININVKRLGFSEQSGLTINRISLHLEAGRHCAKLMNFSLQMPSSFLQTDTITLHYRFDKNNQLSDSLSFEGKIYDSNITPSDLRCFVTPLKNYQRPINITTSFHGTHEKIVIPELIINTDEKDINISANGWLENWTKKPAWHLQVNQLALSENSIDFITKTIKGIPAELKNIGSLALNGTFDRSKQGVTEFKSNIHSGAGNVEVLLGIKADNIFNGKIFTNGLNLQQLLANNSLGTVSADIDLEGVLHEKHKPDISINGEINQFEFKGYTFSNIFINGKYENNTYSGVLDIIDPHIVAKVEGSVTENVFENIQKFRKIQIDGTVNRIQPAAVNLTDLWGNAELSGNISADITGSTFNDAEGNVRLSNLTMSGMEDQEDYHLDNLNISSGYEEGIHFLALKSDFADINLKGRFDYTTLTQSIANAIGSKLPTLPGLPELNHTTNNNFSLRVLLNKTDWLKRFFKINLDIRQPISLEARVNDPTNEILLHGDLPSFAYNGSWYSDANVFITTPSDTMKCNVSLNKILDNGKNLDVNLQANAINNHLNTTLSWDNHHAASRMSGQLNASVSFSRNSHTQSEAHIQVIPSHLTLNNSTWEVSPSDIFYYENRLQIDHFVINREQQHVIIDGVASQSANDALTIDLNEVELAYVLDLVNFHVVEFSGKATGKGEITSLFHNFSGNANLRVDEFRFENGRMGTLDAHANWNKEKKQIDIDAVAHDTPDVTTYINGYVSPSHNTIDLGIRAEGTYIDFMQSFTESFLNNVTGHTNGNVRIAGTLDDINLTGKLTVDGQASITPLNTTYYLRQDTITMIPDEIIINRQPLYDRDGHQGFLSGGIHHKSLTNLTFDLSVDADNLLAYDFQDFGESSFYGTVYASGNVTIHGLSDEIDIDCDVTPQSNSVFVYNAANPDDIASQEFIEWETPNEANAKDSHATSSPNRATDTDIYINFLINTTPDATIRVLMDATTKDYIILNGEGAIRATFHNKGPFNMFGTYTVDHGTYGITIQNIIKKNFTFNRGGTIVFGGDPYEAALNLQAVYTVNGVSLSDLNIGNSFTNNTIRVNCLMNIGGQPNAPQVEFDLEMPTVNADEQQMVRSVINGQQEMNQQVVYLLGIGRFYNQGANNSSEQQSDQTSLAMQSFLSGTLSTQINTLLNQIIKNDNWNFGANISTGNEGWHNAEYEGIINGRMLNNRLIFNGQFGYRDNATHANPSFIGDFDLQYLLYPSGNLSLKVYNQTNDRYFTKSSLNTQGIGVIMKKDFDGLRDLFNSQRKKKKRKAE